MNRQFLSVAYDDTSRILYAGTHGAGVLRLKINDVDAQWERLNAGLGVVEKGLIIPQIEVAPVADPVTGKRDVYLLLASMNSDRDDNGSDDAIKRGIYKWSDGQSKWILLGRPSNNPANGKPFGMEDLVVLPGFKPWRYPTSFAIAFSPGGNRRMIFAILHPHTIYPLHSE